MNARAIATNGIRMHVAEKGEGRPLVFLHGLGWDHELWQSAMGRFSGQYRTIAADTRGHGRSDKSPGPYTIAGFTADWHGLLAELGVRSACLVGFSQGGMIAQLMALEHPEMVGALVLVDTICRVDPGIHDRLEERIRLAREAGPAEAARLAAKSIFSPGFAAAHGAAIEGFVRWRAQMDQDALIEATRAGYGFDVRARLSTISVPTIVIWGEEDALTPAAVMKEVPAAMPAAEVVTVPGAGHMLPVEQPAAFERILASFLERHYPPHTRDNRP